MRSILFVLKVHKLASSITNNIVIILEIMKNKVKITISLSACRPEKRKKRCSNRIRLTFKLHEILIISVYRRN